MIDLGTVKPGSTIRIPFSSFDKDDGSSITMTNFAVGDILVYKDGSTTERLSTNGYTATTDFDGKTGKHVAIIDLSDNTTAGFWAAGSEYIVAIDSVTVDTVTTGGWIARFRIGYSGALLDTTISTLGASSSQTVFDLSTGPSEDDVLNGMFAVIHDVANARQCAYVVIQDYIGNSKTVILAALPAFGIAASDNFSVIGPAPLQATTEKIKSSGRTLDVSSGGEAGIDWANVGSPTTTVGLTGTTISSSQVVASVSGAVGSVTGAVGSVTGNVGGNVVGSVGSVTGNVGGNVVGSVASIGASGITSSTFGAGAIDASAIASDAITAAKIATGAIDADALASDAVTEIWAKAMTELSAVPGVTGTVLEAVSWVFSLARNKITQTATTQTLFKDDGSTTLAASTHSDDGTTHTRGEFG
jgi:hypothetical protein